jgi:quinoprotein glucose dehydrogenase
MKRFAPAMAVLLGAFFCGAAAPNTAAQDWVGWGNGSFYQRFAPADQINASNVGQLKPVWKFTVAQKGYWEITPIVVDGVMYLQDMQGNAIALDAETGRELWRFSSGQPARMRALSYWPGDAAHGPRLVMGASDRIYALDIATHQPAPGFGGAKGYIDIREGFAARQVRYAVTSPPAIYKNLIITGPATQEFGAHGPPGDPRGYDVITGKLAWRFHIVPRPGERNAGSWGEEGWKDRSGPSAWGAMSVDGQAGLVFIPTGNPADSFVGADRRGDNLYANSVLALDAMTGAYRWHFQLVHHDLFDYDTAAAPTLLDLTVAGRKVPALVEASKDGLMFILDRRNGKPVFGVEERAVPQSTIPGEKTSLTQPFPKKPGPLAKLGMSRAEISDITPQAHAFCTALWDKLGLTDSAPFQPPRLNGPSLMLPGNVGGLGGVWGGISADPRTGFVFVNTNNLPAYGYVVSAAKDDPNAVGGYKMDRAYTKFMDANGLPCIAPPWGEMIAVNAQTGDIAWRKPLGAAEIYGAAGAKTGLVNMGGSLATGGNLVFIGATSMAYYGAKAYQPVLRAFDSRNGSELWSVRLSSPVEGNPMSFVGRSGRQYVVAPESGSVSSKGEVGLVAFALPRAGDAAIDLNPAPVPAP